MAAGERPLAEVNKTDFRRRLGAEDPTSILVIQLRQIGDILLTTPVLRALRQAYPAAEIVCLTHPMGRLILTGNPDLSEHVVYEPKDGMLTELGLGLSLRERRFALVLDFMNNPRSAIYARLTGAPERLAFRSARRLAFTATVPRPLTSDYIVREKFLLLAAAGVPLPPHQGKPSSSSESSTPVTLSERLILPWTVSDSAPVHDWFATTPAVGPAQLRVVLSPTHRRVPRRWPLAAYAALADRLRSEWGASVIWIWGPGEEAEIDAAIALCREPSTKAPATTFRGLAALLANCDLFVGNSNGPSHVAVASDTPSLQLHGHTSARAWCPFSPRHQALQSPEYGQVPMPRIDLITGEQVWASLTGMRPLIETAAAVRRARGFLAQWQDP